VADIIGESHLRTNDVAVALRSGHIRTLLGALRSGGRALLVTEVVSNEVLPEIAAASDANLPDLLYRAIWRGDLFTGANPAAIVSWLVANRPLGARLAAPGIIGPWRWRQSPARTFLVVALVLRGPGT
jgi:hypothetical protein